MEQLSLYTNQLYKQLKEDISQSSTIYILSSFIMRSGIDVIFDDLKTALYSGADIKILTGDYLYVTQPEELKRLLSLKNEQLEIRLWQSSGLAFHPKSFLFKHREEGAIIVGSSNLSRSALTSGIEWNLRMKRQASKQTFDSAINHFIQLFYAEETMSINHETIKVYEKAYKKFRAENPDLTATWSAKEEIELTLPTRTENDIDRETVATDKTSYKPNIKPRQAQVEALEALEDTMAEQYNKAAVVMGSVASYMGAWIEV